MDFISNKAITIGVGLLVTIAIVSGVIFSITQVINIYSKVYNTDTSIRGRFDEFDKFDGGEFTTVEVYNTIKKYYDVKNNFTPKNTKTFAELDSDEENKSKIMLENCTPDDFRRINTEENYDKKWPSKLERNDDGTVTITFIKNF